MAKTGKTKASRSAAKKSFKTAAKSRKKTAKMMIKAVAKPARRVKKTTAAKKIDPLNRKNYTSLTPMLTVQDVRKAAEFYTKAFGFKVRGMMEGPGGSVLHAELRLRDTTLMLGPESREMQALSAKSIGNTPVTLYILVDNVDGVYNRAVAAGGQSLWPVADMFWGDRCCMIADPEGNKWTVATHKAEPTEAEMRAEMERQMQAQQATPAPEAGAAAVAESEY